MKELLEQYPDQKAFDTFFHMKYKPVSYDDVKEAMEAFVGEAGLSLFLDDYVKNGKVTKEDFKNYLSQAASFQFEDAMTEAFYDKNPEIYETAFGLYELSPEGSAAITRTFHETYKKSYEDCLDKLFDAAIFPLLFK
jgi:hypothetical protein